MNYIDFALAVSFFLFFFVVVIMFTSNYFSSFSGFTRMSEFRTISESMFRVFLESKGVPEDWDENTSIVPIKIGLMEDLYRIPILVEENMDSARTDEPVSVKIIFDEDCQNKSWNTTIRMYDEDDNEIDLEISNIVNCTPEIGSGKFLNQTNITWKVNISANQIKKYWIYYSPDDEIDDPGYTSLSYTTDSWIPNDRDSWTEGIGNWSRYEGSSGEVTTDSSEKKRGSYSVNITGNFGSTSLGLRYNQSNNITGVSNGWYIDAWIYVDDKSGLDNISVRVNDNNESIHVNITNNVVSGEWYHFVKELNSTTGWLNWVSFNASNGIDYIDFYMENSTSSGGVNKTLKIDGLHFKKNPLTVKDFPEEHINSVSLSKFEALKNISYEEVRKTIGENYKFRIKINENPYPLISSINRSANVGCHEYPKVQYNGTLTKVNASLCVWK